MRKGLLSYASFSVTVNLDHLLNVFGLDASNAFDIETTTLRAAGQVLHNSHDRENILRYFNCKWLTVLRHSACLTQCYSPEIK